MRTESQLKRMDPTRTHERVVRLAGSAGLFCERVRGVYRAVSVCRVRLPFAAVIPAGASFDAGRGLNRRDR